MPNSPEMIEQHLVNIPVNVQGENQALNWENFPILGEGVQNIMLAYQGEDSDSGMEEANDNIPPQNNEANQNIEADLEYFHFNDLVQPEVAHLQLMRAETFLFPVEDCQKFSAQGMELWEKYFAPHISSEKSNASKVLEIPSNWFNFNTLMLLTPKKFECTIFFLNSDLWDIMSANEDSNCSISFVIPDKCQVEHAPACKISKMEENFHDAELLTPVALAKRKRRGTVPLVENEVRRSPRILELNEGFKNHSTCSDKNCLSSSIPPCTKNKIVKSLATSFCKVAEENLDSKLLKKNKKMGKGKEAGVDDVRAQQDKRKKWT
jgi:hypothetical protein